MIDRLTPAILQTTEVAREVSQMDPSAALVYVLVAACTALVAAVVFLYRQQLRVAQAHAEALAQAAGGLERFASLAERLLEGQREIRDTIVRPPVFGGGPNHGPPPGGPHSHG